MINQLIVIVWTIALSTATLSVGAAENTSQSAKSSDKIKAQSKGSVSQANKEKNSSKVSSNKAQIPQAKQVVKNETQKNNNERFNPTEAISEDLAVSFPIDI